MDCVSSGVECAESQLLKYFIEYERYLIFFFMLSSLVSDMCCISVSVGSGTFIFLII